jgi:transposase
VETAEILLSEYGRDLHEFETEKQFVKHLRLAPRQAVSGGKPLRKGKGKKPRQRNLWVTDAFEWRPEVRLARPATPG